MASFADRMGSMDAKIMRSLKDGSVDYLAANGGVISLRVEAIVEQDVTRVDEVNHVMDRVTTICVIKTQLPRLDRKGSFRSNADEPVRALADKTWHIDGIENDDGHLITFYVVP